jgi:hypothetical protein
VHGLCTVAFLCLPRVDQLIFCPFSAERQPRFLMRKPEVALCDPKSHARVGLEWKALFLTPPRGVEHACHTQLCLKVQQSAYRMIKRVEACLF